MAVERRLVASQVRLVSRRIALLLRGATWPSSFTMIRCGMKDVTDGSASLPLPLPLPLLESLDRWCSAREPEPEPEPEPETKLDPGPGPGPGPVPGAAAWGLRGCGIAVLRCDVAWRGDGGGEARAAATPTPENLNQAGLDSTGLCAAVGAEFCTVLSTLLAREQKGAQKARPAQRHSTVLYCTVQSHDTEHTGKASKGDWFRACGWF